MSEVIILKNEHLEAHIDTLGAEIRKIINIANNHNYMWSGDKSIWSGISPVLFPVVGKTTNSVIRYNDKSYPQGNHGFARTTIFKIIQQSNNSITLRIDSQTMLSKYPFALDFDVTYSLIERKLITQYAIHNKDNKIAYFSVGAHPAFACPFDNEHQFEDYYIEFEQDESQLLQHEITPEAFFTGNTHSSNLSQINLDSQTFVNDALIYSNYTSKFVSLKERNSNRQIKVSLDGFPWLGIWSKINASYVCIEPWCGHSDHTNFNGEIHQKDAIEAVEANNTWSRSYSIEFGY